MKFVFNAVSNQHSGFTPYTGQVGDEMNPSQPTTKVVLMFPYSGYAKDTDRERLFWEMIGLCRSVDPKPVVILNRDTENRSLAETFLKDPRKDLVDLQTTWSVDTCQMWLAGWGYILDNYPDARRIVQFPGDIEWVDDPTDFFGKVRKFLRLSDPFDIYLGDFSTAGRFNTKELIDLYGTYALLANWFPEFARGILQLPLKRPRTEFLNIKVQTLRSLLVNHRKFAYEQTLNMLIRSWDFKTMDWRYEICPFDMGKLRDDKSFRQYRECLDQIERTERMLKLLWREINEDIYKTNPQDFVDRYDRLDRRSTSIRDNARIIIRNLLDLGA
jgi:hypothetical protein